nr:RNA polymerase sigma factor [Microbispora sp. H13382]
MARSDTRRRFEEIYMAHYADLLGYVRRRTDTPEDAADVLAETFATAWRRIGDVPAGSSARLWLYGVARRVLANGRRAETRRSALVERLGAELAQREEHDRLPDHEDLDAVRAAFRRLGSDDREVLALASWEGLGSAEIATVLGCSCGAARLRLHRARKRLTKELTCAGVDVARYGVRVPALAGGEV